MEANVLFNRYGLIVLDKPAGMVSQGPRNLPRPEVSELIPHHFPGYNTAHRIDRFTSGVIVCANRATRGYLQRNWHQITHKTYLAVIRNPKWEAQTVSLPLDGKKATTSFLVLERKGQYALVQCELVQNGRKHQIRRHLKSIGSPIVGDRLYRGGGQSTRGGQMLHAWLMTIQMPQEEVSIQSPIPADFAAYGFDLISVLDIGANATTQTIDVPETWDR